MNFIEAYPDLLSLDVCAETCATMDEIISRPDPGSACILSDDASRTDWNLFNGRYGSLKQCEEAIINSVMIAWRKYNKQYNVTGRSFLEIFTPGWKMQRSETGGGFHRWHYEQGSGNNRSRFAVWMIYLNDVETGGKTEFKYQDVSYTPTAGTVVIWPAAYTHVHRAAKDLVGNKYIATGWFEYPERLDVK
jgi:hypothetical protein